MRSARAGIVVVAALLLAACATRVVQPDLAGNGLGVADGPARQWQSFCFRLPFDAAGRPVWATDLVLADRVVAPSLRAHAGDVPLWRFHRRAANDEAGHLFSVLLYTTPAVYAAIEHEISAAPSLATLRTAGRVAKVSFDCRPTQRLPDLAATSDPAWNPVIQRTWPYFIMGVSASWLALIGELAAELPPAPPDLVTAYAAIDARIAQLWGQQGQHAYLHHLSGVYGYKPLNVDTWINF